MKKAKIKIAVISIFLVLSMIISVSARQSAYFSSYTITIVAQADGRIATSGDIMAVGNVDQLGIAIMNIVDADSGETIKTITGDYRYNDSSYAFGTTAQGTIDRRYYAEVTYLVKKGNGYESKYITSGITTAKK